MYSTRDGATAPALQRECVSMDTGHFEDAIRGAHRLLDIRHQFQDAAVLALLVRAVLHDKEDADGNTSASSIRNNVGGADGEVIHSERLEREMEDSEIRQHKRAPSNISSSSYDTDTSAESAVEETECHINNKFWYWLFVLGTALGDEIFYATFIPFWFWNIDGAVGRRIKKSLDFSRSDHMDIALSMLMSSSESEQSDNSFMLDNNKRVLELFGRITSVHQNVPEIWQLYSDLSPSYLLKAQRLLKAYRGYTQEAEDKDKAQADQQLSSARLTGQAVLRAAEKQAWPENKDALERLTEMFNKVTEYMKSVM
ncbi:hypothetical protein MSG28_003118 [Choristoneura fumiferana]|uniref:Uncharacterized protein n=1 Tax=Choristoneura fumiferana TaxID=7141 RepID=A0ACC0KDX9_CHOFU|nr:hypothetical protein MSG28_003118 [Choristoneura fumiferana]